MVNVKAVVAAIFVVLAVSACQGSQNDELTVGDDPVFDQDQDVPDVSDPVVDEPDNRDNLASDIICEDASEEASNCQFYVKNLFNSLETHRYLSRASTKVNKGLPYESDISQGKHIDVYINAGFEEEYLNIDPDKKFSQFDVYEGATIIREVWSEDHELEKYTVMIKMHAGYFPEGGDFVYAVIRHDGEVLEGGRIDSCAQCHLQRKDDGFLFGVRDALKREDNVGSYDDAHLSDLVRGVIKERKYLDVVEYFPMNIEAFPSELDPNNYIRLYVSRFASLNYLTIHRDRSGSQAHLPEESVIVREIQDEFGNTRKFTVMAKGINGYNPSGGDFFYGVYDTEGNPVEKDGVPQEGRLEECGVCHQNFRKNDGFLFGVSSSNRN